MEYKIKTCGALPCCTEIFIVNGINADMDDFGNGYDHCPEEAEDYACGCWYFDSKPATSEVLSKYGITVDEYNEIASALKESLYVGGCGWCV